MHAQTNRPDGLASVASALGSVKKACEQVKLIAAHSQDEVKQKFLLAMASSMEFFFTASTSLANNCCAPTHMLLIIDHCHESLCLLVNEEKERELCSHLLSINIDPQPDSLCAFKFQTCQGLTHITDKPRFAQNMLKFMKCLESHAESDPLDFMLRVQKYLLGASPLMQEHFGDAAPFKKLMAQFCDEAGAILATVVETHQVAVSASLCAFAAMNGGLPEATSFCSLEARQAYKPAVGAVEEELMTQVRKADEALDAINADATLFAFEPSDICSDFQAQGFD
jgi:hypothetical protein